MTSFELLESLAKVKDKYVLEAHGEDMPDKNIVPMDALYTRHRVSKKKRMLIAAILAAVLMLAGFAYAVMKLQELSLGEYSYIWPNSQNPTEKDTVIIEVISLQALSGTPEYLATKEWQDFLQGYDTDGAILKEIGNSATGFEDISLFYQVYTGEMYDKLQEIAEKYDLKLHSEMNIIDEEELDYRVGGKFMGDELSRGSAYIFENGTFQTDGEALIDGKVVHLQLRRTVKGTLEEVVLNIGSTDEYQEIQYETVCGETVFLELGTNHSLVYADFEECLVFMNVLAGRDGSFLSEDTITMEDLKRMADALDFTVLKKVVKPDMRGDSGAEGMQEDTETGMETVDLEAVDVEAGRLEAYQRILMDICRNQKFPFGRELGYDGYPMSDNKFSLCDIDKDGNVELLLVYITTSMAGNVEIIYDYDETTGNVREEFAEFPSVTHFDNGILKADWSHNPGLSGRSWPYTLYQYNLENDVYEAVAMIEAWDKDMADKDYEGNLFPDDIDKDGDGLVYYIMNPDKYELTDPVDFYEYEKWLESYCREEEIIKIPYQALTEENISKLK